MKLGELRAAIRKHDGAVVHPMNFRSNPPCSVMVAIQKTSLLEALGEAFDNDRSAETGLTLREGGVLAFEAAEDALDEAA